MAIGIDRRTDVAAGGSDRTTWDARASRLYEEFRRPAFGMIRRAFGSAFDDSEIEDFYSAAWLGTLRALAKRQHDLSDDEVRSYLLTAVANHASKEIRRRKRKPVAPLDDAATVVPDEGVTPEETVSSRESSQITRDVLSSLPPRRRAVMLLRYGLDLEPKEICDLVDGLSHRAYRKEISRGVEEMTRKMGRVDRGQWCEDREPVLKAYAAGIADGDQAQQAEKHIAHCKHCSDFVGRLAGHLHDVGSAIAMPGALDALDGRISLPEKVVDLVDRARGTTASGTAEVAGAAGSARGGGAVGGGVLAKFAALGGAGKIAAACVGGGLAATACVAIGVAPLAPTKDRSTEPVAHTRDRAADAGRVSGINLRELSHVAAQDAPTPPPQPAGQDQSREKQTQEEAVAPSAPTASEPAEPVQPPPVAAETGLAPPASVGASEAGGSSSSSGGGQAQQTVQQEFGP